ncbi:uncharacterized protein EDB93DRAFT_1230588 [Suillus bovinus]|uniref:uncharacterized protein n=1 Tax=Suillus bovinus TaxID=48563 RepID=UPI001B87FAD8|nr:uncharacterized protein EDB93DRAFT_1230588 [Suillus bovinus]KAG2139126.1 hypothetical protein EDB93DRAFT_1230588 [Suillus bovinus]
MHQALLVPEVLLEILTYVNEISFTQTTSTQRSLAALARTCRKFYEPAMDLLWAEIEELEPLLGCVTRLHPLIYHSDTRWGGPWARGIEPLSAHETRQFLRHSARIRKLNIDFDHPHFLSLIPAEACVFPRLRSLNISTKYLDLFLPHSLQRLYQCHLSTVNQSLQGPFMRRCTDLEHLCIYTPEMGDDDSTANELSLLLSDRIRWCTRLVTLSCPMLDWATWKHLSSLPTLLELSIDQGCNDPPSLLKQDIVDLSPFLSITTISFRQLYDAAHIIAVMQHSQFPSLKEFRFEANYLGSEEAEQLFHALSNCKALQTLEKISIIAYDSKFLDSDGILKPIPHFLRFKQLRTLELIFCDSCIYLDNDILLEAMSTWPDIHTLEITSSHALPSSVTLHGLFTALSLCPQLHTLRVAIDITTIDIDPDDDPIQHTSLQKAELEIYEFITDAESLARIIFAWLPCVDQVQREDIYWDEVNMHLRSLKAAVGLHVVGASRHYH